MIPTVNFGPNPTQDILNSPVGVQQPQTSIPKNKFLDGVRKMQQAEGLDSATALSKSLEYFKSQGKTIEGIDIDTQLSKYKTKADEVKAQQEDTGFFEALGDVLKKRGDKGAEILTAGVTAQRAGEGQGKLESGVQYAANLLGGLAEITGTAFVEGLDVVTPEAIQEKFKQGVGQLAETKGGEFVVGKLQEVSDNMETLRELNPRVARNFEALGNSVDAALTFYGGRTAKEGLQAGTQGAKTLGKEAIEQVGKQADVLGDTAKTIGGAVKEVPGQAATRTFRDIYKLNQNTIEQAFKNPEVFTKAQKVGADDYIRETADKVVDAVKVRADELSELGKEYATIRKGAVIADDIEIGDILTKNLDLVPEKQLTKADRTVINDARGYVEGYTGQLTDEDILSLRKQLDSLKFDPNTGLQKKLSPQGNRVVTALRNDVDNIAKDRIKGLKELDAKFAPEIAEVNKLKSVIFDSRGDLKDRYIADISNLMGKGKEMKIERVRKLIPDIDEKINMYKALVDLDNVAEGFKVGAYAGGAGLPVSGAIGAILGGPAGAVIGAVIYQMVSNPKLGIEIVKKLAIAKDMKDSIIKSIKEGVKLKSEQAKALVVGIRDNIDEKAIQPALDKAKGLGDDIKDSLGDLADTTADKIGARSKFMDDGGKSLDDFSKVGTTESAKLDKFTNKQIIDAGYALDDKGVESIRSKFLDGRMHPDFQKKILQKLSGEIKDVKTASQIVKNSDIRILDKPLTVYRGIEKGEKGFIIEKPVGKASTSGGNTYGISTSTSRDIANDFAQGKGNGEVIKIILKPGTKILEWKNSDGFLDNISIEETKKLAKKYDAILDKGNVNGEAELRIFNKSTITK